MSERTKRAKFSEPSPFATLNKDIFSLLFTYFNDKELTKLLLVSKLFYHQAQQPLWKHRIERVFGSQKSDFSYSATLFKKLKDDVFSLTVDLLVNFYNYYTSVLPKNFTVKEIMECQNEEFNYVKWLLLASPCSGESLKNAFFKWLEESGFAANDAYYLLAARCFAVGTKGLPIIGDFLINKGHLLNAAQQNRFASALNYSALRVQDFEDYFSKAGSALPLETKEMMIKGYLSNLRACGTRAAIPPANIQRYDELVNYAKKIETIHYQKPGSQVIKKSLNSLADVFRSISSYGESFWMENFSGLLKLYMRLGADEGKIKTEISAVLVQSHEFNPKPEFYHNIVLACATMGNLNYMTVVFQRKFNKGFILKTFESFFDNCPSLDVNNLKNFLTQDFGAQNPLIQYSAQIMELYCKHLVNKFPEPKPKMQTAGDFNHACNLAADVERRLKELQNTKDPNGAEQELDTVGLKM